MKNGLLFPLSLSLSFFFIVQAKIKYLQEIYTLYLVTQYWLLQNISRYYREMIDKKSVNFTFIVFTFC